MGAYLCRLHSVFMNLIFMFQSKLTALISIHLIPSIGAAGRRKITGEINEGYRGDQIKSPLSFFLQLLYLCHEHMTESVWVTVCRWLMLERLGMGEGEREYVGTCHTSSLHFLSLISSLPLQCYIPVHSCLSQSLIY